MRSDTRDVITSSESEDLFHNSTPTSIFDHNIFDLEFDCFDSDSDWMSTPSFDRMQSTSSDPYAQTYSYSSQPDFYSSIQQQRSANSNRSWSQAYGNDGFSPSSVANTPPPPQSWLPGHRRALSNSTASTNSPQQHYAPHPQALLDSNHYRHLQSIQYYPTPVHTPTSGTFMDQNQGRGSTPVPHRQPAQGHMKPYPPQIQTAGPQYSPHPQQQYNPDYLTPHSATPRHNTPIPANAEYANRQYPGQQSQPPQQPQYGENYSTLYRTMASNNSYRNPATQPKTPHLEHSMTQICADEGYNPLMGPQSGQPTQHPSQFSMPDHMQDRLQAANAQRQAGTPYDIKRETSPYRPDSQLAREDSDYNRHPGGPGGQVGTVAQQRQQQKWNDDQYQYWRHHTRGEDPAQKQATISPKDAYLDDFKEAAEDTANGAPLFPQRSDSSSQQQLFDARQSYGPVNGGRPYPPSSTFSFQTPGMPASANIPSSSGVDYKFATLARAESSDDTPAHLVSMETSKSEPSSSQENLPQRLPPRDANSTPTSARPSGSISTADTGTYSCTYIGCPQRFPTPALLQKHKKDAHRPAPGVSARHGSAAAGPPGTASPTTATRSVSPGSGEVMSQAGPHRCDRINPSTGKPCNTVFSRPYDLTRHEDTIHARRPKVHCQYCQARGEEKTFSRADALTRHLRVVHPEVEVRGLHGRRRGL